MDQLTTLTTPQARVVQQAEDTLASRSSQVKEFVKDVSPCGSRCIIENSPGVGIQLCHAFGRANSLNDSMMSSIEFKWNMPLNSLNLDTRRNCFLCGAIFHGAYDQGQWCLMPDHRTIIEYMEASSDQRDRNSLKDLLQRDHDKGIYKYTVLGIDPAMDGRPIYKQKNDKPTGLGDVQISVYPYNDPIIHIISHLHPKFVILSIGHQMAHSVIKFGFLTQAHLIPYKKQFHDIFQLYSNWTKPLSIEQIRSHPRVVQEIIEDSESEDIPQPRGKKTNDDRSYSGKRAKDQDGLSVSTRITRQSALRMKALTDGGLDKEAATAETSSVQSKQTANTSPRRITRVRKTKKGGKKRMADASPSSSPPPSPTTQTTRVTQKTGAKKLKSDPVESST